MNLLDYQKQARTSAIYLDIDRMIYPALGLIGECGEVAENIKKLIRDDNRCMTPERKKAILKELGDCIWYCANICCDTDNDLSVIYVMRGRIVIQRLKKLEMPRLAIYMNQHASIVATTLDRWHHEDHGLPQFTGKYLEVPQHISHVVGCVEAIAKLLDSTLEKVCIMNIEKLTERKRKGIIRGDGSNR